MPTIAKGFPNRSCTSFTLNMVRVLLIALLATTTRVAFAQSVFENLNQLGESIIFAPEGIAVDTQGLLLVTEIGSDYIHQILPNDTTTATMRIGVDGAGSPDGTFNGPVAIAFDRSGNIFVADLYNHRIQKFNSARVFQGTIVPASSLVYPLDVAVDSLGNIYVSDNLSAVKKFDAAGQLLNTISLPTSGPVGLGVDSHDNLFVVLQAAKKVAKYNSSGLQIGEFGTDGTGNGQFKYPRSLAIDSLDNIYVDDGIRLDAQKFNSSLQYVATIGGSGTGAGQFQNNKGVAVDDEGRFFMADSTLHKVEVFGPAKLLTVAVSGNGGGSVTSSPGGISCGSDCKERFDTNAQVTLTATAPEGAGLVAWSGGGCEASPTCVVTMSAATTVSAEFATGPDVTISKKPASVTKARAATFKFRSTTKPVKFECQLDGKSFKSCKSPMNYTKLKKTTHTFSVRAKTNGITGLAANYTWRVR